MSSPEYILKKLRNLHHKLSGKAQIQNSFKPVYDLSGQAASDLIATLIKNGKPSMIARFGSVELECASIGYLRSRNSFFKNSFNFIREKSDIFLWHDDIKRHMFNNAGFFPATGSNLQKFSELLIADMGELDVLGSWLEKEKYFQNELKKAIKIPLQDIEPYYHQVPWTRTLEGKRVLVVHPYAKSIRDQYSKKDLLFKSDLLPSFELITMRSVQSISGNKTEFGTWFEALDHMKKQIDGITFDVAIIGCGAYGFPLAAHVKRKGKIAIHMGGATQILFGIKGKRWEEMEFFRNMFNEHWVRALQEETPENSQSVEGGCYW
jgi:hypothetical protein